MGQRTRARAPDQQVEGGTLFSRATPEFSRATPEIETLRASALAGGEWYEGSVDEGSQRIDLTVMVNTSGDEPTGFDLTFKLGQDRCATFEWAISQSEAQSIASESPVHGWAGWASGDIVLAWQMPEVGGQDAVRWEGRSPLSEDELDPEQELDAYARLAAALILMAWDEGAALNYLPVRE